MDRARDRQIALLSAAKQREYFGTRRTAIIWGWIHLWTFPLFSWTTFNAIFSAGAYLTGTDISGTAGKGIVGVWFGSAIPLIILAIIAGKQRKKFAKQAAAIRTVSDSK